MISVGLTGNVGSGYDKVSDNFKVFEVPVFDADIALKFLLNYRVDIIHNIKIRFGSEVYNKGLLNPFKFNTTEKFDKVIDLAQPELLKLYDKWRSRIHWSLPSEGLKTSSYVIFKSGILFERGLNDIMSFSISVFRPKNERAMDISLNGVGLVDAYSIIDSEMDELDKNQMAEWTIHNYDSLSVFTQVKNIHDRIETRSTKNLIEKIDYSTIKSLRL